MGSFSILLILIVIVAFFLVAVIMVQNPKGGGLSSSFGGGGTQQLGGVQKTTDFLDKSTWFLAIFLIESDTIFLIMLPGFLRPFSPMALIIVYDSISTAIDFHLFTSIVSPICLDTL